MPTKKSQLPAVLAAQKLTKKGKQTLGVMPLIKFVYAALILSFISLITIILLQNNLPPEIPLFYGLAEGSDQVTQSINLIIPSLLSLAVIAVNVSLSFLIKNKFLQKSLAVSAFVVSVFSILTSLKIIVLVGSL